MMRSVTIVFVAAAVTIIASSSTLRSRSLSIDSTTAAVPFLQELHATAGVDKLPAQHIEDLSVIFSMETKQ